MFTVGTFPFKENSHGRAGNRTQDLMISSQRLWPLDHEASLQKNTKIKILWKSFHWEPWCSVRTDRRTDIKKLTVALCNFTEVPEYELAPPLTWLVAWLVTYYKSKVT